MIIGACRLNFCGMIGIRLLILADIVDTIQMILNNRRKGEAFQATSLRIRDRCA